MTLCLGGPVLENPEAVIALSVKCLACGLDVLGMKDRFPVGVKSLLKISQTSCGSQTFSSSVVPGVLTPVKRRPRCDARDSPHLVLGLRTSGAVLLPLRTPSWVSQECRYTYLSENVAVSANHPPTCEILNWLMIPNVKQPVFVHPKPAANSPSAKP